MSDIWSNTELLDRLERERNLKRIDDRRLTFDCMNLKCKGDRAYCSRGKRLGQSKDGSLYLISVLKGITSGTCRSCEYFTTEEGGS